MPEEFEWQTLSRTGITIGCRIVETEHLGCVVNLNDIIAEYIGAEESIRTSSYFAREPPQRQRRHSLIPQLFAGEHEGSVFSEGPRLRGPLPGSITILLAKRTNP